MAFGSVTLEPGVNVERTPILLRAGISTSNLIRFRDGLVQKYGGWQRYYQFSLSGVPRDLHAWEDLNNALHLAVGTTLSLNVITSGASQDITPQTLISNFVPNISSTANSNVFTITDPNIANVTTYDSVLFEVPVSVGGVILDGLYPITLVTGTTTYEITTIPTPTQSKVATTTEANPTATNNTTAIGNPTLHFASTPSWVADGMLIYNLTHPSSIPVGTTVIGTAGTTVTMSANAASPGVSSADNIVFISIPIFTTISGNSIVTVNLLNHGLTIQGQTVVFEIPTTFNGVTISGSYSILGVTDANNFTIQVNGQATSSGSLVMNSGNVRLEYLITLGPLPTGSGYGLGLYGAGNYGFGAAPGTPQTGTPITATDWTSDNWGEILVACPKNGPIYTWDPTGGFINAEPISSGPPVNGGIFVSTSAQILVAYSSSIQQDIGYQQQPMLVQWTDVSNFNQWAATAATQAGNFTIPIGSQIMAGVAVANQNLIFTDLDLWAMAYIGPPGVYGFNKVGAGMGAVSSHAVQQLRGGVFWMGRTNFYSYGANGANVLPCPVWDAVFQNINTNFLQNVRAMPNTPFNEVGWLYPSAASVSGECDSYVKMNITEQGQPWDYGLISRSAWIDQTVLGMPIGASPGGLIFQHETTANDDGIPLIPSFTTGYFYLAEGEEFVIIDQILPDFKWATFTGGTSATVQISFNVINYPGDTPRVYGPYNVTSATKYVTTRFRGRMMSITISSGDLNSFWRIGSIKYRYAPAGRR